MGREIERMLTNGGHGVVARVDEAEAGALDAARLRAMNADVAFEFSTPDTALRNVALCLEAGIPVVCGTTGWLERYGEVEALCARYDGTFFYASNFSVGVNVFFSVNQALARLMDRFPQYDVSIEETHHTQKKDAPSGTAITLAEGVVGAMERKSEWRPGAVCEPSQLGVASVRRGDVAGIHTVTYESPTDRITLTHETKSRAALASGAVMAAEFIVGKKGIFTMSDLLGI